MSTTLKTETFFGQRALLSMTLAAGLVTFGCSTDRNLGNGGDRSGVRMTPTGGVGGYQTPPPVPVSQLRPMTSSSRAEALPLATRPIHRLSPDEAALIMAQQRPKYRVLGIVSPALSGNRYYSANLTTGQWQNPAMRTNPQQTINSSLTSGPTGGGLATDSAATAVAAASAEAALNDLAITQDATVTPTSGTALTGAITSSPTAPVAVPVSPTGVAAVTQSSTALVPTTATPTNASATATRATAAATPASTTPTAAPAPVRTVTAGQTVTVTNGQQ